MGKLRGLLIVLAGAVGLLALVPAVSAASTPWTLYNYNSSGNTIVPTATDSTATTASFDFASGVYTGALTTNAKALTGDLTNRTMSATFSVTNMTLGAYFLDQNNGGCSAGPTVRLYFTSAGTGSSGQEFYTTFWWSNPVAVTLTNNGSGVVTAPLTPANWSDWNGQPGSVVPDAFSAAVSKVLSVGLSFGGGCFFENGVTTSDGSGTFNLTHFSD